MRIALRLLAALLAGAPCAAPLLAAEEGAGEARGLSLTPRLRATAIYDDNVRLAPGGGDDDLVLRASPGLETRYAGARLEAGLDLGFDGRFHLEHEDLNEIFWDARAFVAVRPTERLRLEISDHFVPTPLALGAPEDTVVNQEQANWLRGEARYDRELSERSALELGLRGTRFDGRPFDTALDLDGDGVLEEREVDVDYEEARGWLEGRRTLGRDHELFARLTAARRSYAELDEADFLEVFGTLGARAALTARIDLEVALGWGALDFDAHGRESRWVGELGLVYELPRHWTLRLAGARSLSSDVVGADFARTSARFEVRKRLGRRTRAIAALLWAEYDRGIDVGRNRVIAGELRLLRALSARLQLELAWRHWRNRGAFEADDFTQDRVTLAVVLDY